MTKWSTCTVKEALKAFKTDPLLGLSTVEAARRQQKYGSNQLRELQPTPFWRRFLTQFAEFLILLLVAAAVISLFLGGVTDALVILTVVGINAVLGTIQEYRAEKALKALKTLSAPTAKVIRAGVVTEIASRELVRGDIVLLEAGDFVPADGRLLESSQLRVDQSALTGESEPAGKNASFIAGEDIPLAEKENIVHMGTAVVSGRAKALVTATGMDTEIGRIAKMLEKTDDDKTPLQKKLEQFGRQLGILALLLCLLIFVLGVIKGNSIYEMFLTSVSLAVAAIPEGLPAIVTIVLALGVQRMARHKAIIRKLPAVETLGAATVICSDKTGTLTRNVMTVRHIVTGDGHFRISGEGYEQEGSFFCKGKAIEPASVPRLFLLLKIALLTSNAVLNEENGDARMVGDPTEGALVTAAAKAGLQKEELEKTLPRVKEYPFDSNRKIMSTIHRQTSADWPFKNSKNNSLDLLLAKGAPGPLLERCCRFLGPEGICKLDQPMREQFLGTSQALAEQALRVLGFALRPLKEPLQEAKESERDLIFVGLAGLIDPPRAEAGQALKTCRRAGIKVKMITGDHKKTALAIAREMGLAHTDEEAISGIELDQLSPEELQSKVDQISIFARVSPEHKVRIVEALQNRGEIVAMTGDGVNDAPALKKADIGAAMGLTGTDVARGAADMILADDNFATIVQAVQEGRIIFENIKKAVYFLLSTNVGEIFTILGAILLGWPLPLLPIQILWINLVTDSLPALAIGVDSPEKGAMQRPPRRPQEGIFEQGSSSILLLYGLFIASIALFAFHLGQQDSISTGQTMAFATLAFSQLVHVFNFRSLHESIFSRGFAGNRSLLAGVAVSAGLQLIVLLVPQLMLIFKVMALTSANWIAVVILSFLPLVFGELLKLILSPDQKQTLR